MFAATPKPNRPALTVTLVGTENDVLARGISQDVTVFQHIHFRTLEEAYTYFHRRYKNEYKVVLNIHPSAQRFA